MKGMGILQQTLNFPRGQGLKSFKHPHSGMPPWPFLQSRWPILRSSFRHWREVDEVIVTGPALGKRGDTEENNQGFSSRAIPCQRWLATPQDICEMFIQGLLGIRKVLSALKSLGEFQFSEHGMWVKIEYWYYTGFVSKLNIKITSWNRDYSFPKISGQPSGFSVNATSHFFLHGLY